METVQRTGTATLATVTTSRLNSAGNFFGMVPSFQREHFPQ
jgi:hypothetical protein